MRNPSLEVRLMNTGQLRGTRSSDQVVQLEILAELTQRHNPEVELRNARIRAAAKENLARLIGFSFCDYDSKA